MIVKGGLRFWVLGLCFLPTGNETRLTNIMVNWKSMTTAAGSAERQFYSQAGNHCASNGAIFENTIQYVQEI